LGVSANFAPEAFISFGFLGSVDSVSAGGKARKGQGGRALRVYHDAQTKLCAADRQRVHSETGDRSQHNRQTNVTQHGENLSKRQRRVMGIPTLDEAGGGTAAKIFVDDRTAANRWVLRASGLIQI